MHQPLFRETRADLMHEVMMSRPLGTLVTHASGRIEANHLPFVVHPELSSSGTLRAHIHKGNPLWQEKSDLSDVLVIFQGPQSYITPSWYPSKLEHGKTVPTWNYVVVHARGSLVFRQEADWLLAHLTELTSRHEASRQIPWNVTEAPADYLQRQLRGIVGLELEIQQLEGTWKVSQNRDEADRNGVAVGLGSQNTDESQQMASLVTNR